MTLKETLIKLYEGNPENFPVHVEMMKRKAAKGIIADITPEAIDRMAAEVENSMNKDSKAIANEPCGMTLAAAMAEVSDATEKFGYLCEDTYHELDIQNSKFLDSDVSLMDPPIDPSFFPNEMGINLCSVKKEKWVKADDGQLKKIEIEFDPATPEEIESQGGLCEALTVKLSCADARVISNLPLSKLLNVTDSAIRQEIRDNHLDKDVSDYKVESDDKSLSILKMKAYIMVNGDASDRKYITDRLEVIESLERKAKEDFSKGKKTFDISYRTINGIYNRYKDVRKKNSGTVNEAVTYIDNMGNVKTTSAEKYVENMHEYDREIQIKPYKKKKEIEYKLLDENLTLEEILRGEE